MDLAIRDLIADELELVAGGDAPNGAGTTDDEMCTTPAMIFDDIQSRRHEDSCSHSFVRLLVMSQSSSVRIEPDA